MIPIFSTNRPRQHTRPSGGHYSSDGSIDCFNYRTLHVRIVDGRGTLSHVAVGDKIEAEVVRGRRTFRTRSALPVLPVLSAAAPLRMVLHEGALLPAGVFRAIDEGGEALCERSISVNLSNADGGGEVGRLTTETGGGAFLFQELIDASRYGRVQALDLQLDGLPDGSAGDRGASDQVLVATLTSERLNAGEFLGDVVFVPRPLIDVAAGRVVDERGAPFSGVSVSGALAPPSSSRGGIGVRDRGRNRTLIDCARSVVTAADGTFTLRALADPEVDGELTLHEPRFGSNARVAFRVGARNLVIELVRNGWFEGSVRLPEGVNRNSIKVRAASGPVETTPCVDGIAFRSPPLPPGSYDVSIYHCGLFGDEPLATIDDIEVQATKTLRDPSLQSIDVREVLRTTAFAIVDAQKQPIESGTLAFVGADETEPIEFRDRHAMVASVRPLPEVVVRAPSYRTRRVTPSTRSETIDLAPALPFRVAFSAKGLPADERWCIGVLVEFHYREEADDAAYEAVAHETIVRTTPADREEESSSDDVAFLEAGEEAAFLISTLAEIRLDINLARLDPRDREPAADDSSASDSGETATDPAARPPMGRPARHRARVPPPRPPRCPPVRHRADRGGTRRAARGHERGRCAGCGRRGERWRCRRRCRRQRLTTRAVPAATLFRPHVAHPAHQRLEGLRLHADPEGR